MTTRTHANKTTAALNGKRSRERSICRCPAHAFADDIEAVERSPPGMYTDCCDEISVCLATDCFMSNKPIRITHKITRNRNEYR